MPQLVVLAAIGAGLYAGSRILSYIAGHVHGHPDAEPARERSTAAVVTKDLGQLEFDPSTGVYRPAKH